MTYRVTSLLSPVSDSRVIDLVDQLGTQGLEAEFVSGPWEERFLAATTEHLDAVWVCGLLHVELTSRGEWSAAAVAAPRSTDPASAGTPVYHGRIVVADASPVRRFDDLIGHRFAYNEESSLSGYGMMLDRLSARQAGLEFFSETIRSGSHVESVGMVLDGRADCAIIDSLVMEDLAPSGLRVVESVGPYPAPPLVARRDVIDRLGPAAVAAGWAAVDETTYDLLRERPR